MRKPPFDKCPYCGSDLGLYIIVSSPQEYTIHGEACGYYPDAGTESDIMHCLKCDKAITRVSWYEKYFNEKGRT